MRPLYALNFQVARNEDWSDVFALTDDAGAPVNLTGVSFTMDLKTALGTLVLSLNTANGKLPVYDAAAGLMGPLVLKTEMGSALPAGVYNHDCLMLEAGRTRRLWYGQLTVLDGVTA